jgi:phosphoadenosine phosphosulfate reductase
MISAGWESIAGRDDLAVKLDAEWREASPYETLRGALQLFADEVRVACSLGVEDMVILHETARAARDLGVVPRVFLLDTGRLHEETYDLLERARDRYGLAVEAYAPDTVALEDLVRKKGPKSFFASPENRRECCAVRKVAPLGRALSGARAWVTGLRRAQAESRSEVATVEVDHANGGLLKVSPLAFWSNEQVWAFVREHHVPTHALHARGYPSIGCAPCTRAVEPGQDARAGRWWWERDGHKECGLHERRGA